MSEPAERDERIRRAQAAGRAAILAEYADRPWMAPPAWNKTAEAAWKAVMNV